MDSVRFAQTARLLADGARALGLEAPGFRSPPRLPGVDRSVRRRRGAPAAVAVRRRGRPHAAVVGDMVEGVVIANHLAGDDADRVRRLLLGSVGFGESSGADGQSERPPSAAAGAWAA